jgi:hypothetical protein
MERWVEISFDCLPLRSVSRLDAPVDASPKFQEFMRRVKECIEKHGAHNTYYLYNAQCIYHLANSSEEGMIDFAFDGVAITDETDQKTRACDLRVNLTRETCPWLTEPIVAWFAQTVQHSVAIEFDRFIAAGDLTQTKKRMEKIQAKIDEQGGYLGMYL